MDRPIRILLTDDHPIVREGMRAVIERQQDMEVIGEARNGLEAIELYRQHQPDIVLMDLHMPIMNGVEAIGKICGEFAVARIIVLTTYDGDEDIHQSLGAGAAGYLLKEASNQELLDAIRVVYHGKLSISPEAATTLAGRVQHAELTQREQEVLREIAAGKSNKEIGATLFISQGTVKSHINGILSKLGAVDRTQAVIFGVNRGYVHLD